MINQNTDLFIDLLRFAPSSLQRDLLLYGDDYLLLILIHHYWDADECRHLPASRHLWDVITTGWIGRLCVVVISSSLALDMLFRRFYRLCLFISPLHLSFPFPCSALRKLRREFPLRRSETCNIWHDFQGSWPHSCEVPRSVDSQLVLVTKDTCLVIRLASASFYVLALLTANEAVDQ